jgi:ABC-type transport system involved in multi-copper enzyme maturation permease subunit
MRNLVFYELRFKLRFLALWILVWVAVGLLYIVLFEPIRKEMTNPQALLNLFPPELLKTFNISLDSFTHVEKFLVGKFFTFYLLIAGISAAAWGSSAIWGKVNSGTMAILLSKGLSRMQVFFSLALANFLAVLIKSIPTVLLLYLACRVFTAQQEISLPFFIGMGIVAAALELFCLSLGMLAGVLFNDIKAQLPFAYTILAWIIDSMSTIENFPHVLQLLTPFYFLDLAQLTAEFSVNAARLLILCTVAGVCFCIASLLFVRKNIFLQMS